jgi:hypothetical protein
VKSLNPQFFEPGAEACCFTPEGVMATTESRRVLLFTDELLKNTPRILPPPFRIGVRPARKAPVVDGNLNDWDRGATELPVQSAHENASPAAHLFAAWNQEGIYLAGIVPDEELKPLSDAWYAGDCVEVFIGRDRADRPFDYAEGDDRCYLGFARNADGSCGPLEIRWPRHNLTPAPVGHSAGKIGADQIYQWELFLPASVAGEKRFRSDQQIRLNVSILSQTPRRNWYISTSNAGSTWLSPITWAVATLQKE